MGAKQGATATDPRVERSRTLVRQAALAELGAVGYGAFTIESVAVRAGVAKTTVYRHWPSKLALISDALETLNEQPGPDLGQGSPRERVECLVRHVAEVVTDSTFSACIPALIDAAEREPDVRTFHHRYSARRRQALVAAIAEGVATGDFPATLDPELAALALVGPIFYSRLMSGVRFDAQRVGDLVDTVLGPAGDGRN